MASRNERLVDDGNDETATTLPTVRYVKLSADARNLEKHGHGFILCSAETIELAPFERAKIRTDLQIKLPSKQFVGRVTGLPTEGFRLSAYNSGLLIPETIVEPEQILEIFRLTAFNMGGTALAIGIGEQIAKFTVEESPKIYCFSSPRLNSNTIPLMEEARNLSRAIFRPKKEIYDV